ncbi:RNA-directed DNA polymerase [Synechococcus sp. CCY9201]|uniref:RNA-directed DNA polymerase n=1 Tax=Synechococcus sp. CCY9201 TaxID=174697 RepID=UPI002B20CCF1|nr:RNA-directed DNA polymerase [Synechococcus sp. CCY9201]MEA5474886.1 RNA-directed DNA polymerase [Synechococcus sp. CCY9201]
MRINQLASKQNLELAWRRITTGGNYQYKRLYRPVYYAYEVALEKNLQDLQHRLLGGSFEPRHPERIYVPKQSGLHRPLALLNIEDQIVLQAFANLSAQRMQKKRAPLQFKVVFSNLLERQDSIFFFRRWQDTYGAFQRRIEMQYENGLRWVGDFDLAAFYDTISHELLLRTIYPRTTNSDLDWMGKCLKTWSSDRAASGHGHGLPQGPLASDFLAECFLLPIDCELQKRRGYTRYVDDVRLFGETEDEVRADLIELERLCRERGLIPQAGKFAIKCAQSAHEAMGMLPSISDPQHEGEGKEKIDKMEARGAFLSAISGKPYRVTDKTRLRYILFRAEPDSNLLTLVLRLIPHHPEHADAFFAYLGRFGYRKPVERMCRYIVVNNPYAYVRGEAWHVLAKYSRVPRSMTAMDMRVLTDRAVNIAKDKAQESFVERWGACHFLCVSEEVAGGHRSRWLKYQAPLLQSLLAPVLPVGAYAKGEVVETFLVRSAPEPGLSVCSALHERGLTPATFGLTPSKLPSQVANTLRELGVISAPGTRVDPIAELLRSRYGVPRGKSWHTLLAAEYVHALGLLKQAEAAFAGGRSFWLACQNSFNQTVFLALQQHLAATGHPAACTTVDKKGQLVDFGVTLDAKGPFSKNCPSVGGCFRDMNARRNHLPVSHPYEKKTAAQSRHLKAQERNQFIARLRVAYLDFVALMP